MLREKLFMFMYSGLIYTQVLNVFMFSCRAE